MQSKVSFSNSSFSNLNKYIKSNNPTITSNVLKNSDISDVESINLSSSNINGSTIYISNSNSSSPKNPTKSSYSITSHSDSDNVNINQIRCIIRDAKNEIKNYQNEDCELYFKDMLIRKYNYNETDAEIYAEKLKDFMLTYSNASSLVDYVSNEKYKGIYDNAKLNDYLIMHDDNTKINELNSNLGYSVILDLLEGYQNEAVNYLDLYYNYLEGKTLTDAMNEYNYKEYLRDKLNMTKGATYDSDYMYKEDRYNKLLEIFNDSLNSEDYELSYDMKKSIITEIVDENNYDAMILQLTNGNYAIVNSCTNEKENEDLAAIIGSISNLTCTDSFSKELFGLYSSAFFDMKTSNTSYYSDAQISACEKTIKRYIDEGKNMELYGYSLGGGIMEAAYARILVEGDPKYTEKIKSVCVYNPFTLIAEQDSTEGVEKLAKDNKLLRYCAEGDVVSIFNHYVEELDNNTLYLNAAPINSKDWLEQKHKLCEPTELFTKGNHSFSAVNGYKNSSFDEYGNVTKGNEGEFVSISNVIHSFVVDPKKNGFKKGKFSQAVFYDYDEKYNTMDLEENMKISLPYYGKIMLRTLKFDKKIPSEFNPMIDEILQSFGDNFGNINYSTFSSVFGKYLADYIYDQTKNVEITNGKEEYINVAAELLGAVIGGVTLGPGGAAGGAFLFGMLGCGINSVTADTLIDESAFKDAIRKSIIENEATIITLTGGIISEDREAIDNSVDILVEDIIDNYSSSLENSPIKNSELVISKLESNLKSKIKSEIKIDSKENETSSVENHHYYSPEYEHLMDMIENGTYDGSGLINPDYTSTTTTTTTTVAK